MPARRRRVGSTSREPSRWGGYRLLVAVVALVSMGPAVVAGISTLLGRPLLGGVDLCALHATTGLWCPLCGGTRATAALLRGEVSTAMAYNPAALVVDAWLLTVLVRGAWWFVRRRPRGDGPGGHGTVRAPVRARELYAVATALVLFGVVRNLPGAWAWAGPLLGPPGWSALGA